MRGPRRSSCRTGATVSRTRSTSSPTRTSPSTSWRRASSPSGTTGSPGPRSSASPRGMPSSRPAGRAAGARRAGAPRLLIADLAGVVWAFETQALDDVRAGADPGALSEAQRLGDLGGPALTMSVDRAGRELLAVLE